MSHFRTIIRDKAATLLTGLATTGAHVWSGRVAPLSVAEMPGLVLVPGAESSTQGPHAGGPSVERVLQLVVIGEAVGNDGLYDVLDDIAGEVETALFAAAHANLDGLCEWLDPPDMQMTVSERGENSAERIGTLRMVFPIHYRTAKADPSTQA